MSWKDLKLRWKLSPVLAVAVIALVAAFMLVDRAIRSEADHSAAEAVSAKIAEITAYQGQIEQYCLSHAALFSTHPNVREAYALAHSGDISNPDDPKAQEARALLQETFAPIKQGFARHMGDTRFGLHFHLPNGRSLLRCWRDSQNASDDISSFRRTVMDINQGSHTPITGVEVGRGGFVIRGLVPVTGASGEHLGSVEMLSGYVPLVLAGKTSDVQDIGVYMNADLLEVANKLTDKEKYPRIDDEYVLVASTNNELLLGSVDRAMLDAGGAERATFNLNRRQVTVFPIDDYAGNHIGAIVYSADVSAAQARLSTMRWTIGVGAIIVLFALALTLSLVANSISGPIVKVVDRLKDIAQGEGDLTLRVDQDRKDEVGELGLWFNTFVGKIESIIREVKGGAMQIDAGSEHVSTSSQTLSESASEQAASLQEINATLEIITSKPCGTRTTHGKRRTSPNHRRRPRRRGAKR
jgi:methyl-accepting chemotaxis protein